MIAKLRTALVAIIIAAIPAAARARDTAPSYATFASHGATLAYTAYGSGPIVVVLAGGPGLNAAYMAPLARIIAADGYRAIVLDQRGTGRSVAAGSVRADLTMRGTVADIDALRVALHQERLTFVTHSFGGGMALAYAAAHPTAVARMILIGSVGTDLAGVEVFGKILMTHLSANERAQYAVAQRANDGAKALDIQLLAEFDDRAKARATIASEPHPFIYPKISDAIYTDFAQNYHVASALRRVRAHVTLLTGSDDAARAMEPTLRQTFPNATRAYVPHSGHWPWIENVPFFDRALRTALYRELAVRACSDTQSIACVKSRGTKHVLARSMLERARHAKLFFGEYMPNIVETAVAAGTFKTLVAAVTAAGLADTLSSPGPFTVFAPSDDAFAKLPAGTVEALLADIPKLKKILTYHVVSGDVRAADVAKLHEAKTVEGSNVHIHANGGVKINESNVTTADIACSNGVIHVVDAVLLPK